MRSHQKVLSGELVRRAAAAVIARAASPRFLGALPGLVGVLHTWTRALDYHPHVQFLVPAGGLSKDGARWLRPRYPDFFLPERALAHTFRAGMKEAVGEAGLSAEFGPAAWEKRWVVHVLKAGDGLPAPNYLSRRLPEAGGRRRESRSACRDARLRHVLRAKAC